MESPKVDNEKKHEVMDIIDTAATLFEKTDFENDEVEDEARLDYWIKVLEVETGLNNITDYIFWPDSVGLELNVSLDEIIAKILEDKTKNVIVL